MSFDDRLRDALDRVAPPTPDAPAVRAGLGSAMSTARRRYRVRRAVGAAAMTAGLVGGTAVAAVQLAGSDNEVDTISTLPSPDSNPATPATSEPPAETPDPVDPHDATPETTSSGPAPTTAAPGPIPSTPLLTDPPSGSTTSTPTTSTPTPTSEALADPQQSGPHATVCGDVTFSYTATTVEVVSHTAEAGYRFSTEGEGTLEVKARWDEGPGQECELNIHVEDGVATIELDEDDTP